MAAGLAAIAVADHDTVSGLGSADAAAHGAGILVVPAVELSAEYRGHDVHVLGYFVDRDDPVLGAYLERLKSMREARAHRIVELVRRRGVDLSVEQVMSEAGIGRVGRAHVARALVAAGAAASLKEAFDRFLGRSACCYVPKPVPRLADVIRFLSDLGAAAVLAHPGVGEARVGLGDLLDVGLVGLECEHPEHPRAKRRYLKRRARELGLVVTGGSDWHGDTMTHPAALGAVTVGLRVVEELRSRTRTRRADVRPPGLVEGEGLERRR